MPKEPTRVCHISTVHPLRDVRVFVRECCSLADAGYDVHLVINADDASTVHGVHIHPLPQFSSRVVRMLAGPLYALKAALRTKADIYHYHDPELLWMGFILRWIFQKRVVFDIHETVYRQLRSKTYFSNGVAWAAANGYLLAERVLSFGQIKVVANAASVADYKDPVLVQNFPRPVQVPTSEARFETGRVPSLVYVGAVTEIRGALIYLELARRLKEENRAFELHIIGPFGTESIRQSMLEFLRVHELESSVHVTGPLAWQQAMQTVAEASIGLCLLHPVPNYTSCLATKIIEYMMLGTPVLASDFDCWRPFVEGERAGRMADPLDIDQVYEICTSMLDDQEELKAMSQRGPTAVSQRYTWEQEFQKLVACYDALLRS